MQNRVRVGLAVALLVIAGGSLFADDCSQSVSATWLKKNREMRLDADYKYVDPRGVVWLAPKNSKVNGASIPKFLWSFMGGPYEGLYRDASVVHDVACDPKNYKNHTWQEVHQMFYDHMICSGVSPALAKTMYWAVYQCGPRWGDEGTRWFACGSESSMSSYLAAVLCAARGCPGSQLVVTATGNSLQAFEDLKPEFWKSQPQVAMVDLTQPDPPRPLPAPQSPRLVPPIYQAPPRLIPEVTYKVLFAKGQVQMDDEGRKELDLAVELLKNSDDAHADISAASWSDLGTPSLAAKRAEAVQSYLVSKGVERKKISVIVKEKRGLISGKSEEVVIHVTAP